MRLNSQIPTKATAVTPSSTVGQQGQALYIGGDGDVTLQPEGLATAVTFVGLRAGSILPIRFTKVTAATATNLLRLHD